MKQEMWHFISMPIYLLLYLCQYICLPKHKVHLKTSHLVVFSCLIVVNGAAVKVQYILGFGNFI